VTREASRRSKIRRVKRALKIFGGVLGLLLAAVAVHMAVNWEPDRPVEALAARWAPPPSQFVPLAGMSVHLRDEGPREDPLPIVLLHGTSASLHTWEGWAATLKQTRRVISYDMPGFGLTGPDPAGDYTIGNYVKVLVAVLDHLGVQRCVLGGNSLGGYVAWAAAAQHPQRVERLVLVDAGGYPLQSTSVPLAFRIMRTPGLRAIGQHVLPRSIVESSVRNVFGDPDKVTPALVDRYFELATREGNRAALEARFRQTLPDPVLIARIRELKQPTLILWGGRDGLIPPAYGQRFHQEIAGSHLVMFDDLGHVPQEEDAARTVAAVQEFFARPAGVPGS
jgi:pimeloyl-ACP methyl ester carboxylesterase